MSTVSQRFCRCLQSLNRQSASKRKCYSISSYRQFTTTARRFAADEDADKNTNTSAGGDRRRSFTPTPFSVDLLDQTERETFESLPIAEQDKVKEAWLQIQPELELAMANDPDADFELKRLARKPELRHIEDDINDGRVPKSQLGFWGGDEDDELGQVPDEEQQSNQDMTSIAHEELGLHREIREYTRLAAWDMPFLSKFAKPYSPPPLTSPLRFRYTTYMGESHPAQRKVVVEFCPADLQLNPAQQLKLKKLVGARYNPDKNVIKMSCEKFDTPAQNKRYLGDLIATLITEAKDTTDTFEDIPLDLRHHRAKPKPRYPSAWNLNEDLAKKIESDRFEKKQSAAAAVIVDGDQIVHDHIASKASTPAAQPEPVHVNIGGGRGGRRSGARF